jgi:hypothetical protein
MELLISLNTWNYRIDATGFPSFRYFCPFINFPTSFTMEKANEIFSSYHSCQCIIDYVRFRDHLCPDIQDQILLIGAKMVSGTSINFNHLTWLKAREEFINSLWLMQLQPLCHFSVNFASFSTSWPSKSDQWSSLLLEHPMPNV